MSENIKITVQSKTVTIDKKIGEGIKSIIYYKNK